MREIPRLLIAGTHSGSGKTTVARSLMSALRRKGLIVQPFKVGPDFIDPTHHTAICGRVSRNLDPFMMGENGVMETFTRACEGADIAVIEGVMGLFDGIDGGDEASTAHVARILSAPVLLVVDVLGLSRSTHAIVQGYASFDPGLGIAGIICNRVGSGRHQQMIARSRDVNGPPILGWLPRHPSLLMPDRHLGLHMAHEIAPDPRIGELFAEHCDMESILGLARSLPPLPDPPRVHDVSCRHGGNRGPEIGVAMDRAFCFYYRDNLERLERAGAKLVYFSPTADPFPEIQGLYLGGGYPELYAAEIASSSFPCELGRAAADGMPVLGECGGLLVMCRTLSMGRSHRMSDVLPAEAHMSDRLQALDYAEARVSSGSTWLPHGISYRGHEFHYSRVEADPDARFALTLARGKGIAGDGRDGLFEHHALGCYMHAYFTERFAASFIAAAEEYGRT